MPSNLSPLLLCLLFINLLAAVLTLTDKRRAVRGGRRIPEATLLFVSAIGGAPAMYMTMLLIRHKTRKAKFMVGIPLLFILELLALFMIFHPFPF